MPLPGRDAMSDDHLIEHRVQQDELLRGKFLHVFRDTVRLPNQHLATREYVVHPGAVMVPCSTHPKACVW